MAAGLSAAGLEILRLADIKAEIEAKLRADLGSNLRLDPAALLGNLVGTFSERESLLWELLEQIYGAAYPSLATGAQLDRLLALIRLPRLPASSSTVLATLTGTPGTVVPAGSIATVTGTLARFALDAPATIGGGGTIVGTSWTAVETGPIIALAGQLATIATPIGGWSAITNPTDAQPVGRAIESDVAYRGRQARNLRTVAGASAGAIQASLYRLAGATEALIIENRTSDPDSEGRPGHSFEAVVRGATDADVAATIWATKPAGIETYGTTTTTTLDAIGEPQIIHFSRPVELPLWIAVDYTPQAGFLTAAGEAEILADILTYGSALQIGADVVPWEIEQLIETPRIRRLVIRVGVSDLAALPDPYDVPRASVAVLDSTRVKFHVGVL